MPMSLQPEEEASGRAEPAVSNDRREIKTLDDLAVNELWWHLAE